ncbi:Protein of unknown function (DUF975) [Fodinibius salinus]|uniref:DUF975 family protein n=1 Tax=Fodinibius salinus TaxID=860790 RepID=A0A5D3YGH7_9BACT|nr:DUF975 family protein [Fodinibius salinus]TYP92113.1 Protein of unknown function (DUF975) [Fodinibius salinus]
MQQRSIDLAQLFSYSFQQFKKYAIFIVGATLTLLVVGGLPQTYFMLNAPQNPTIKTQFFSFVITLIQAFLSLGFTKLMLLLVQDKPASTTDMFNNFRPFISYFVGSFLYGIATVLGLLLFIVPGIFIMIRFQFYPYIILEENDITAFSALKKSYMLTEGLSLELFLLGVSIFALNIAGILLFGIGILFSYPLTAMATAVVYKSFSEEEGSIPIDQYQPNS